MNPSVALPARRISDLLSSGLPARAKSKREAMDQPRTDPDQELVKRTQSGAAAAFDELVIKYTPRLYGLVYNMTSNHEDTNDLLQDIFAKAYKAIRGFRGKSSFYTWIHSIAVNITLHFLKKRVRRFKLSLLTSTRARRTIRNLWKARSQTARFEKLTSRNYSRDRTRA